MRLRFLTLAASLALLTVVNSVRAQAEPPPLAGSIEGNTYTSPLLAYKVEIPVLQELGGVINDTDNVVTFQDQFNVHASIACFPMDATQRWENETRGRKDYLIWFFGSFVQADFRERFPGSAIESAKFIPNVQDGGLLVYNTLPGGSMFNDKVLLSTGEAPPVAKRGNLLFVKYGCVYVLSIEYAEKVLERKSYDKTKDEEDEILRKRLLELLGRMNFPPAPAPAKK